MAQPCPICDTTTQSYGKVPGGELYQVHCPRCGQFELSRSTVDDLPGHARSWPETWRVKVSYALRRMQEGGRVPFLTIHDIDRLVKAVELPAPPEQGDKLILWLGDSLRNQPAEYLGRQGDDKLEFAARIGAIDDDGAFYILQQLEQLGLIETSHAMNVFRARLTFEGWSRYEELKHETVDSRIVFMAMPFGDRTLDEVYQKCFKRAVAATGFELRRLDEEAPAGLIDNRLRVEIRRSRLLIAELTNDNSGAYWEAGFTEGLGRPVIYTYERDYFDQHKTHFDTNHCKTIVWSQSELDAAAEELKATIRATLPTEALLDDPVEGSE